MNENLINVTLINKQMKKKRTHTKKKERSLIYLPK